MKDLDRAYLRATAAQIQVAADGDTGKTLKGYAALFNDPWDVFDFKRRVAPGAFAASLQSDRSVAALFNHDDNIILGRSKDAGNLELAEDAKGLAFTLKLSDDHWSEYVSKLVADKRITQMSFGWMTISDAWSQNGDDIVQTILEVDLWEVSPVTFPANPNTTVSLATAAAFRAFREKLDPTVAAQLGADEARLTETDLRLG